MASPVHANPVAVGANHACALTPSSGVRCMGDNYFGQLGDGTYINRLVPVDVVGLTSGVQAVAAGYSHTCALLQNGEVWCWGFVSLVPKLVGGGVAKIAANGYHTCAVLTTGNVECWGYNSEGQLGNGTTSDYYQSTPTPVALAGGDHATSVAAGVSHTCARTTSGKVQCWGANGAGELGRDTSGETVPFLPKPVTLASTVVNDGLTAGDDFTCAITGAGVQCWGRNDDGQLGVGDTIDHPFPTIVSNLNGVGVTALAAGHQHTCAATSSDVRCWGYNTSGELGNGGFISYDHPGLVSSSQGFGNISIAAGSFSTCALSAQGMLRCWGLNSEGQFGNGTRGYSTWLTPSIPLLGNNVSALTISAGGEHTCSTTSAGDLQCWGDNTYGEIGDYSLNILRPSPKRVASGTFSALAVAVGSEHTCAVDAADGTAKCWGRNWEGQVGDGTHTHRSDPVAVLKETNSLPLSAIAVGAGADDSCAIDAAGGVWCWGVNDYSQLGIGKGGSESKAISVALAGNGKASGIAVGTFHTCAVGDTVQCWGDNSEGEIGVPGQHDTPVVVPLADGNPLAREVVAGRRHTCALTDSGAVQCWGHNTEGELGQGDYLPHEGPTSVPGLNGVKVIALTSSAASDFTCALSSQKEVWCWGELSYSAHATPTLLKTAGGTSIKALAVAAGRNYICVVTPAGDRQCVGDNAYGQLGNGEHGAWPTVDAGVNLALSSQKVQFTSNLTKAMVGGPPYHVTAMATSNLPVSLTIHSGAATVCSINNGDVSFLAPGTCIINADQPGDAQFGPAPQETQSIAAVLPASKLAFTAQPADTAAGEGTSVAISIEDSLGNVIASDNATQVTLSINRCGGAILRAVIAQQGVASFSSVRLNTPGVGLKLHATSNPALASADSSPFDVAANPIFRDAFEACVP